MDHRFRNVVISLILAAGIVVPVWLWMRSPSAESLPGSSISGDTPISGTLTVAVDRSLAPVAEIQTGAFSERYPHAVIKLSQESSRPLGQLLRRQAGAVLIEGSLSAREDSALTSLKRPVVKRQPVARNALVFVVNRSNTVSSITLDGLKKIFSGRVTDWKSLDGTPGRIVACLDARDQRLPVLLSEMLFGNPDSLVASAEPDQTRLLNRVRDDPHAAAVLPLSAYAAALRSGDYEGRVKVLPVSAVSGATPVQATPETLYEGRYPLSTVVFYLYDPYDPLATGFGAWLAKEGQKLFERGDMAPYEQLVRTIILK
jgi:phosphate transport system substrate-binding protein